MDPLTVPGTLDYLSAIGHYVQTAAAAAGLDKKAAYRLRLAVDEIATNIVSHGYAEAGQPGDVTVQTNLAPDTLTISLEDTARPFDPRTCAPPDHLDKSIEERPIGGLGVYLTIQSVDQFDYEYVNHRNRNIFVMRRAPHTAP